VTAAWQLAKLNAGRRSPLYEITVYEANWRLGGKGASGRDEQGRIHEHGLHVWLGFYENAFRMMRECYAEVAAAAASGRPMSLVHQSVEEAFSPESHIGVASRNRAGRWEAWTGYLPPMRGEPGTDFVGDDNPFTLAAYLTRALALTRALILSVVDEPALERRPGETRPDGRSGSDEQDAKGPRPRLLDAMSQWVQSASGWLDTGAAIGSAMLLQAVTIFEVWLREFTPEVEFDSGVLRFVETLAAVVRRNLARVAALDERKRRKTEIIDLVMTVIVGLYRDRVLFLSNKRGLDKLDGMDCREWLRTHGATHASLQSPFITGLYDLAFCYRDGDREQPALAAGQALRGALRMFFTYRGSLFWRMNSGMGDAIFAPLYRVLAQRGVQFRFHHRLHDVAFSAGLDPKATDNRVERLCFEVPASVDSLNQADPLDANGCWLHRPPAGSREALKLAPPIVRGKGFDSVIFAMGVDDFVSVCDKPYDGGADSPTFFQRMPAWQRMREHTKTVATRAAQAWFDVSLADLGWRRESTIIAGLDPPFETWADMTHTLAAEERWRPATGQAAVGTQARSVAYFCGVLKDADVQTAGAATQAGLQAMLAETLHGGVGGLWTAGSAIPPPIATHVQANAQGSERFTLSLPGSIEHRISPLDDSVINMSIAGDWTACGFNESCVEAAVMSGMLAAQAISGRPDFDEIIGYDHP
jgi:uncharacterized protein with NAD-binding domain and iron-sulfur cluster